MIEINANETDSLRPLLAEIKQQVLPYAICEGINLGRILVDKPEDPRIAMVWSTVGYYILAGEINQARDLAEIRRVLTEVFVPTSQARGENGFILVPSSEAWEEHLPTLLPGRRTIKIYRRPFTFDAAQFSARGNWRESIPDGLRLQAVDGELAERLGVQISWGSIDDFLANGLGFALMDGSEIVSSCFSIFASQVKVEVDVHTAENYRRRGLAALTASALIEACLQGGKLPNWECFWDNAPSIALAGKLGFSALPDYPVYYWEE